MLSWWRNIVFALLLAGVISADDGARLASENASADSSIKDMRVEIGEDLPISIPSEKVTRCYVTRNKDTVELAPKDESNGKIVRREPNALFGCQASINNIQKEDAGIWKLGYETENSKDHIRVNVVINEKESDSLPNNNGNEDEALDTILRSVKLPRINHNAHLGSEITITLSKQLYDETCYLKPPRGDEKSLEEEIPGVTAFPTSTYFVSCRVVIGPMKYNLLGTWTLCGRHSDGLVTYERCQPANIQWIHDNPEATWDVTTNPVSDQPIHFGITLTPNVKGRNEVETCHIVTPNGEDLTVGTRSDYPGLTLVIVKDTCRIDILPVNDNFVGNWTLYGTFQSAFWYNSLAQPLNVFIYDEEDPYNQAYNVTNANSEDVLVNMGNIMTINVAGRGDLDKCEIVTNTGERYDEDTAASLPYVKISSTNDDSKPMCVIQVGPITKDLLGNWRLIGKFNRKDIHSEIRLPFNIIEDDPRNPFVDESRMVQNLSPRQLVTSFGSTHDVSTPSDKNGITQSCHIRTPDNLQYVLMPGQSVAGVEIIQGSSMSCGVRMHVESEAVIGDWVLISREYTRGEHIEKRLAFTISIEDVVPAASKEIVIAEGSDMYQWRRVHTCRFLPAYLPGNP